MVRKSRGKNEAPNDISRELLMTFEHFFMMLVGRLVNNELGSLQSLKESGTKVPKMEREKSSLEGSFSDRLLA
jgi:hypothetical protein